jgi:hypothetical protein
MLIGDLLPAALAAWMPHRASRPASMRVSHPPTAPARTARLDPAALPRGLVAVAPETQAVLAAAKDFARGRSVELQMAVEPHLVAQADAADYQTCLRQLILDAIGRAHSGVLVTAMRQADGVEIAVLDDGTVPTGARRDSATPPSAALSVPLAIPPGATLSVDCQPERGTTVLLRLPLPNWLPPLSDADAADGSGGSANP